MACKPKTCRAPLTERVIRPACQAIKLDPDAAEPTLAEKALPWKKPSARERAGTLAYMRQVAGTSMIQVGENEYRLPTRSERRRVGMVRRRPRSVLTQLAQSKSPVLKLKRHTPRRVDEQPVSDA